MNGNVTQLKDGRLAKGAFEMARHRQMKGSPDCEALVWYRECLEYARCRLGAMRMNRCGLKKVHERAWTNVQNHTQVGTGAYLLQLVAEKQFRSDSLPRTSPTFSAPDQNFSLSVHSSDHIMTSQLTLSPFFKTSNNFFLVLCIFLDIVYLLSMFRPLSFLVQEN